jgi:hypothetical protein
LLAIIGERGEHVTNAIGGKAALGRELTFEVPP